MSHQQLMEDAFVIAATKIQKQEEKKLRKGLFRKSLRGCSKHQQSQQETGISSKALLR